MGNQSSNRGDRKKSPYFSEVKAVKNEVKPSPRVSTSLRSDRLPSSHAVPAGQKIHQRINFKLLVGLLLAILVLIALWYSLAGAGRPLLEQKLVSLLPTATRTVTVVIPSPSPSTDKPAVASSTPSLTPTLQPSNTPLPTLTLRPTNTLVIVHTATDTLIPVTPTPIISPTPACWEATTITIEDVGKTLCIQGTVIETIDNPIGFMVIFSQEKGSLYWLSYDMVWSGARPGTCYQVEGTISQLANSPILLFGYDNIPEECP